jgi:flavin-dependent dehydrogenase
MNDEANADGPILGAALPMGFNRVPHYTRGVMLVGDSAAWSIPSTVRGSRTRWSPGALAAEVAVQAIAEADPQRRERTCSITPLS